MVKMPWNIVAISAGIAGCLTGYLVAKRKTRKLFTKTLDKWRKMWYNR